MQTQHHAGVVLRRVHDLFVIGVAQKRKHDAIRAE